MIACVSLAHAQSAAETQEILSRLDRLEKANAALMEQILALRQELATRRGTETSTAVPEVSTTPPSSPTEEAVDERLAVQQSRIDELSETKVEASEKFPIRITGMALFNAYLNGRDNNNTENPTIASSTPEDATGGATLRQTTLGILFSGPQTFLGGKVSGSLYMDFFGGSTSSLDHLFRLRTAGIKMDWTNTSIMVGQDKPLISPRDPNSLAQVSVSPLTGAGNLWLWLPQIRFEQRFTLGADSGLNLQLAGISTSQLDATASYNGYAPSTSGTPENSDPGGEGRVELWRRWGETGRLEIAGGFHFNRNHVYQYALPTNIYSLDWFFRPVAHVEFSGMFFQGRNVAILGALPQGYTVLHGTWISVPSTGGWAQLRFPVTSRLEFNVYGGQEDDRNSDLLANEIGKNQAYFANVMYRFAPNVIVSLEGGQVRTTYLDLGNRWNDHYDLGLAYLF